MLSNEKLVAHHEIKFVCVNSRKYHEHQVGYWDFVHKFTVGVIFILSMQASYELYEQEITPIFVQLVIILTTITFIINPLEKNALHVKLRNKYHKIQGILNQKKPQSFSDEELTLLQKNLNEIGQDETFPVKMALNAITYNETLREIYTDDHIIKKYSIKIPFYKRITSNIFYWPEYW